MVQRAARVDPVDHAVLDGQLLGQAGDEGRPVGESMSLGDDASGDEFTDDGADDHGVRSTGMEQFQRVSADPADLEHDTSLRWGEVMHRPGIGPSSRASTHPRMSGLEESRWLGDIDHASDLCCAAPAEHGACQFGVQIVLGVCLGIRLCHDIVALGHRPRRTETLWSHQYRDPLHDGVGATVSRGQHDVGDTDRVPVRSRVKGLHQLSIWGAHSTERLIL